MVKCFKTYNDCSELVLLHLHQKTLNSAFRLHCHYHGSVFYQCHSLSIAFLHFFPTSLYLLLLSTSVSFTSLLYCHDRSLDGALTPSLHLPYPSLSACVAIVCVLLSFCPNLLSAVPLFYLPLADSPY